MKYKGFLLATVGGLTLAPGAQAADLQVKAPAMAPLPASWTGWYIGAHAGVNWQQSSSTNNYTTTSANVAHTDGSGFIGGGQIGYNWQHGNSVFGVEGDFSWLGGGGSNSIPEPGKQSAFVSNKVDWLSTVRGRMGLAVGDTMVYATGGVAIGHANNSQAPFETGVGAVLHVKSESKTKVGWVVGGGIEHMWDQHWTVGLEGLFVDLGKSTASIAPAGFTKSTTFSNQIVIGRVKLNYKF
jgi:outer membrane immunogenic protein